MVTNSVKNSYIEILKGINNYLTISDIAKYRKVSRTAIYKGIYKLIDLGYLRKIGNIYEVTEQGLHYLNKSSKGLIRLHNLAFKISIINKQPNWNLKRNKIINCRASSKQIDINNNSFEIHNIKNIKIKTTNNSIIFYMPNFYGINTDDCFQQALDTFFNTIPKIESLFKIMLIKDRKCNIEIISQHYAKLQDTLAKLYKSENNKLNIYDENGNLWLIADYSFRVDELETIYNKTAKEDMDVISNFLNDLRKNPATISQIIEMQREISANQLIYAKNQETHINLYKSISNELKGLSGAIKDFKGLELKKKKVSLKEYQSTLNNY